MEASKEMLSYFEAIDKNIKKAYDLATKARKAGYDPEEKVELPLAKNMAERVEGLISAVAPQIKNTGIPKRIQELEKEFGTLDWRVALKIAEEVAQQKFCKFKDQKEAIEVGMRVGFAYLTLGTVSSPLEGFVELKIRKRQDGKEYIALCYSGPVRSAGGTAAAVSVIIGDYLRQKFGYAPYDPTEPEIKRMSTELYDYHERVTNLQYLPSVEEIEFLAKNLPVQIDGDPSEKIEVSNYKDLPRVETNQIRSGVCLVMGESVAQKAKKVSAKLSNWASELGLDNWSFLKEFVDLQTSVKAKETFGGSEKSKEKIAPVYTYIEDLVAGRPVLTHPLRTGGFRLRYGRGRTSGYSAASIHPATTYILNKYIAIGTQLKVERPGKAASLTTCDTIEGPIVKLNNGTLMRLESFKQAKEVSLEIAEIVFLGDILFNYGDFFNRAHPLLPPGYCEEWWIQELEKATVNFFGTIDTDKLSELTEIPKNALESLLKKPLELKLNADAAIKLSEKLGIPLYPRYTYHWKSLNIDQLKELIEWFRKAKISEEKVVLPLDDNKRTLEILGVPHILASNEFVVVEKDDKTALLASLGIKSPSDVDEKVKDAEGEDILSIIMKLSGLKLRDKSGVFIGARMGRPEKAKMRKLTGSPHVLFPVGEEGGKLRSFQSAMEVGEIRSDFELFYCPKCKAEKLFPRCESCDSKTKKISNCSVCGNLDKGECKHGKTSSYKGKSIDINGLFKGVLGKLKLKTYPDLIKGVRGTSNKDHTPEQMAKGILRAKHGIAVNKDGTTRYDMTQLPITHFKPIEIETSIDKLKELGYKYDIEGKELVEKNQILELKPQDVILPACHESIEQGADKILLAASKFIDEMLLSFYGLQPFYNYKKESDVIGSLVVALAPHTSAGIIGRVIGFSATQGFFAHPLLHASTRRDCFSADTYLPFFMNGKWQIKKIGDIVEKLKPTDIIDNFGTREIKVKGTKTIGGIYSSVKINNFTKHTLQSMIKVKTKLGRTIKTTHNHKHLVYTNKKEKIIRANELKIGDSLAIPYKINVPKKDITKLDLLDLFSDCDWVMVRGVNNKCKDIRKYAKRYFTKRDYDNFTNRDSYPIKFILSLIKEKIIKNVSGLFIAAKRDHIKIPVKIDVNKELLQIIGLYVAEGYSRKQSGILYQVYIAAQDKKLRKLIYKYMKYIFGLVPSEKKLDRLTYSSRVLYYLFTSIFECGSSAHEKRLPSIFLNLPNEKLGFLLSGYFEGDGSVSARDRRVTFDTVSEGLLRDLDFVFAQMGIFVKNYTYKSLPGKVVRQFYERKGRKIPEFTITKGTIQNIFIKKFSKYVGFISSRKKSILKKLIDKRTPYRNNLKYNDELVFDEIVSIEALPPETSYCLNVPDHKVIANSLLSRQCDGDEASIMLLMDALINFSRHFLPNSRGSTQDAPLVLTSQLVPSEVDDMAFDMDIVSKYPLEFYSSCMEYKYPWEVEIEQLGGRLNTPLQYEKMSFTHNTSNINLGVKCSAYKTLPSMEEKLVGQLDIADKIRAVDAEDVARLVIEKHFLRDIKGNLRKFSMQQFRCVNCNEKYRRPPLIGKCTKCEGKIIFTVSEGSIVKYLEPAISIAEKYNLPAYLKQSLELTKRRVEGVFGKEKEKQEGLGKWFSNP